MLIGQKLREIREAKKMSQMEIAESTGLVQPYVSREENGHTIPGVETLEKCWPTFPEFPHDSGCGNSGKVGQRSEDSALPDSLRRRRAAQAVETFRQSYAR